MDSQRCRLAEVNRKKNHPSQMRDFIIFFPSNNRFHCKCNENLCVQKKKQNVFSTCARYDGDNISLYWLSKKIMERCFNGNITKIFCICVFSFESSHFILLLLLLAPVVTMNKHIKIAINGKKEIKDPFFELYHLHKQYVSLDDKRKWSNKIKQIFKAK